MFFFLQWYFLEAEETETKNCQNAGPLPISSQYTRNIMTRCYSLSAPLPLLNTNYKAVFPDEDLIM